MPKRLGQKPNCKTLICKPVVYSIHSNCPSEVGEHVQISGYQLEPQTLTLHSQVKDSQTKGIVASSGLSPSWWRLTPYLRAHAASYISAPSLPILAAYIQFTDAFTCANSVTCAQTRFVRASPKAILAMAAGLIRPFSGCSPIDVATPVRFWWDCAITATSLTGSCRGPTHCCWATNPGWQPPTGDSAVPH